MAPKRTRFTFGSMWLLLLVQAVSALFGGIAHAGNPVFDGWYADPDAHIFGDEYWIYPTSSKDPPEQTYFEAFSSKDLITWENRGVILDFKDVPWSTNNGAWAPSVAFKDGKYFLYFSAGAGVGIGVAVADNPAGPFKDALGAPLIPGDQDHFGAQPIDAAVFIDDDGRNYLYYGGMFHCVVVELENDMITPKGDFVEITPPDYTEAPFMVKRGDDYFLMYSIGIMDDASYAVQYVKGDNPFGPFDPKAKKILSTDPAVGTGPGHHSVFSLWDEHYIAYHRRQPGDDTVNNRQVCIDRMYFSKDGGIEVVKMTTEGVEARPFVL